MLPKNGLIPQIFTLMHYYFHAKLNVVILVIQVHSLLNCQILHLQYFVKYSCSGPRGPKFGPGTLSPCLGLVGFPQIMRDIDKEHLL